MFTEESAYKVLNNILSDGSSVAGIPIIISAYNEHKDNAGVVENMCTLFMELSEYSKFYALYMFSSIINCTLPLVCSAVLIQYVSMVWTR